MSAGQWITLAGCLAMCGLAFAAGWYGDTDTGSLVGLSIYAGIFVVIMVRTSKPPRDQP